MYSTLRSQRSISSRLKSILHPQPSQKRIPSNCGTALWFISWPSRIWMQYILSRLARCSLFIFDDAVEPKTLPFLYGLLCSARCRATVSGLAVCFLAQWLYTDLLSCFTEFPFNFQFRCLSVAMANLVAPPALQVCRQRRFFQGLRHRHYLVPVPLSHPPKLVHDSPSPLSVAPPHA